MRARGQAAIELCVLVPFVVALAWSITTALAAGVVATAVEHSLDRAAVAAAGGGDPVAAARAGLPPGLRAHATVRRRGALLEVVARPAAGLPTIAGATWILDP